MAVQNLKKEEEVRLDALEVKAGAAEELPASDRARLKIAGWVLGTIAVIFVLSCYCLVYGPDGRLDQATAVFEFVKTMGPPIATLVIGFYFRGASE